MYTLCPPIKIHFEIKLLSSQINDRDQKYDAKMTLVSLKIYDKKLSIHANGYYCCPELR